MAKATDQQVIVTLRKVALELEPEEAVAVISVLGRICGQGARDLTTKVFHALELTRYGYSKHQEMYRSLSTHGYDAGNSNLSFKTGSLARINDIVAEADRDADFF